MANEEKDICFWDKHPRFTYKFKTFFLIVICSVFALTLLTTFKFSNILNIKEFQELLKPIIELINSSKWIIVILGISYILKNPISSLIGKIKGVSAGGVDVSFEQNQDQSVDNGLNNTSTNDLVDNILNKYSPETIQLLDDIIKKETNYSATESSIIQADKFLKYSQALLLQMKYDNIYSIIYGSQLKLLLKLNSEITSTKTELISFFTKAKNEHPERYSNYSYEAYLNYLHNVNLIIEKDNEDISITIYGKDFIKYIVNRGYELDKRF